MPHFTSSDSWPPAIRLNADGCVVLSQESLDAIRQIVREEIRAVFGAFERESANIASLDSPPQG